MNIKLFYIVGVEGCGHHALKPVISTALSQKIRRAGSRLEIHHQSINALNGMCSELWYRKHEDHASRIAARDRLQAVMQAISQRAAKVGKVQVLIQDNSFPSHHFREIHNQWDLTELAELASPYADLYFLCLYRDPIATTWSHHEWDGGLHGHAGVIATFLEYLHNQLSVLDEYRVRIINFEDLVNRPRDLALPLADYLGVAEEDVRIGLTHIRQSNKNWRTDLSPEDQLWISSFFDENRVAKWSLFHEPGRNLLVQ